MKARVWGYRGGTLLPDGFESVAAGKGYGVGDLRERAALVPCLLALLSSVGVEACIGTDEDDLETSYNKDVERWQDVTEHWR